MDSKRMSENLDDMVIDGKRMEEHDKLSFEISEHLKDRGFKTNIEKIQLGNEEVKLFGFIKNRETVKMPRELKEKTFLLESQKRKKIC